MKLNFPDYWKVKKNISNKKSELYVLQSEGDEQNFPEVIEITFKGEKPTLGRIINGRNTKNGIEIYVLQSEGNVRLFPEVIDVSFKSGIIVKMEVS